MLRCIENFDLLPKLHVVLHSSHTDFLLKISKFLYNTVLLPSKKKVIPKFEASTATSQLLASATYSKSSTSPHLTSPFSLSKDLSYVQSTFNRRTSGQCLGKFIRVKFFLNFPVINIMSVNIMSVNTMSVNIMSVIAPTAFFSPISIVFQIMWSIILQYWSIAYRTKL